MLNRKLMSALVFLMAAAPGRADFSFVHVTDTHFTEDPKGNAAVCSTLFREISSLTAKPAFVIDTGDIVEAGTPAEYALFRKVVGEDLTIPIRCAPGNHDARWNPLGKEGFVQGTRQPLHQSWDADGVHFVLLDSTVLLEHWGHFAQADLNWLAADLARVKGKPTIIGFHHGLGANYSQIDNDQAFLQVIRPHNIRLLLIGHGHADKLWNVEGIPAVMAKGLYQGSYHVVTVGKDYLDVFRRTEAVPRLTPVVRVPLERPVSPSFSIRAAVEQEKGLVTATTRADARALPTTARLAFRVDEGAEAAMTRSGNSWNGTFPAQSLQPGIHRVQVIARLAEGREYRLGLDLNLTGRTAIKPTWTTSLDGAIQGHPSQNGEWLYVPTMDGSVSAIDTRSGARRWKFSATGPVFTTPLSEGKSVYFGSVDHSVYAVDAMTGRLQWKFATQGGVYAGAALAHGTLCIASADQTIYGLDAKTGQKRWGARGQGLFQSRIATDGERFFVGGWDNFFRAIDARTGQVLWEQKFGRSFYYAPAIGAPCVAAGRVYVTSNDGILHAMDAVSGKLLWETTSHSLGYSAPLYSEGKIYNASLSDEGRVFCFDAETGQELWNTPTGSVIYDSSVCLSRGVLTIAAVNGVVTALQTQKQTVGTAMPGEILWQYRLPAGHVLSSPIAFRDGVAIGSMNAKLTAFPLVGPGQEAELSAPSAK